MTFDKNTSPQVSKDICDQINVLLQNMGVLFNEITASLGVTDRLRME